ncbi:response regulator [Blastomonas sp.]|uniref:response regulator n=1 Tax=Blastomonas sp. TaxID=1909299 RepID=UPI003593AAE3
MTDSAHILLVDDEPSLREPLAEYLVGQGFAVTEAGDAAKARSLMRDQRFSIILLDIMMPGEDGLSLCRHVAAQGDTPVILITAKGEAMDRIIGLEIGADDYVVKPFNPRELVARIKTVLRRSSRAPNEVDDNIQGYAFDGWTLDIVKRRLTDPDGALVPISTAEFKLLQVFAEHAGHVLNRDQLLDLAHGREAHLFDRAIDNQISRLRKKVEVDNRSPKLLKTVWGGGYTLAAKVRRLDGPDTQ